MEELNAAVAAIQPVFMELFRALVDEPEVLTLEVISSGSETMLYLSVSKRDLGKLIGKQGRTAQAIRLLLASASKKYAQRVDFTVHESTQT